jgi:hypothetical protein
VLTLEDAGIVVHVLDPVRDTPKFGSRYCTGGYIWQIIDTRLGELFSGPRFPDTEPPVFDGQGAPEVFELALGRETAKVGEDVWVIGVGRVRRESPVEPFHVRDNPTVVERATWSVEHSPKRVTMRSRETFGGFALELVRHVSLDARRLTSATELRNLGAHEIPLRWFAHPFLPWASAECFELPPETTLPENPGFVMKGRGVVERRAEHGWSAGCYVVPKTPLGGELAVTARHPLVGNVHARCRFPLAGLALWGNERTVSFEPFHVTTLAPNGTSEWAVDYEL